MHHEIEQRIDQLIAQLEAARQEGQQHLVEQIEAQLLAVKAQLGGPRTVSGVLSR